MRFPKKERGVGSLLRKDGARKKQMGRETAPRVTSVPKDESDFLVLGPLIERGCPMGRLKSSLI